MQTSWELGIGKSMALGMTAGPLLGGYLANLNPRAPYAMASATAGVVAATVACR